MNELIELLSLPEKSEIDRHLPTGVRVYGYTTSDMKTYARACVAHATTAQAAEIEALRAKTAMTMGVGTGDGKLFVHGDYESIKAAQEIVLERDALRVEVKDYRTNGAAAVRFAPSSAHWSKELRRLFGDDARTGIEVLESRHRQELARAARLEEALQEAYGQVRELCEAVLIPTAAQDGK